MASFKLRLLKAIYDNCPANYTNLLLSLQPAVPPEPRTFLGKVLRGCTLRSKVSPQELDYGLAELENEKLIYQVLPNTRNPSKEDQVFYHTKEGKTLLKLKKKIAA